MSTPKLPQNKTNSPSGSGAVWTTGTILAISDEVRAQVRLDMGNQVVWVRTDLMRAKGVSPKVGETWIMDQPFNSGWVFAATSYTGTDDLSWTPATLLGTWANASTPGSWTPGSGLLSPAAYLLDADGWVSLQGTVSGPSILAANTAGPQPADIMQLPVGYRPDVTGQRRFVVASGTAAGQITVFPDGYVRATNGSPSSISLEGVRFLAAQ